MRITMRHYFDFGSERALVGDDLARPEAWDALRVRSGGPFAMPESRVELDRVDAELTDDEWRDLLARFEQERVVVVATEVATLPRLAAEVLGRVRRRGLSRAGWLRTRDAFEALWEPTHSAEAVDFHDLHGWVLEPQRPHNITAP